MKIKGNKFFFFSSDENILEPQYYINLESFGILFLQSYK